MDIFIWGRVVERIMISFFAGCSLFLGWHLFVTGVVKDQTAEIEKGGLKIKLRKVAPGVFFALFGVVTLIYGLSSPLTIDKEIKKWLTDTTAGNIEKGRSEKPNDLKVERERTVTPEKSSTTFKVMYADGKAISDAILQSRVAALNTPIKLVTQVSIEAGSINKTQLLQILRANEVLKNIRHEYIRSKFGNKGVQLWSQYGDAFLKDEKSVPESDRGLLEKMKPWMTETVLAK